MQACPELRRRGKVKPALHVMEATSKFHRAARRSLAAAGYAVAIVNPLRARLFGQGPKFIPSEAEGPKRSASLPKPTESMRMCWR